MEDLATHIQNGMRLSWEESLELLEMDLSELCRAADQIRQIFCGDQGELCTIVNGRSGRCSEDCRFCAQSCHYHTGAEEYPLLSVSEMVEDGLRNEAAGVHRYSIVTAGRGLHGPALEQALEAYRRLHEETGLGLCASHGLQTQEEFCRMREAGVTVVHCADSNLDLCSGFAPVRVMLDEGLKVALGSDVAGGDHLSMFDAVAAAIRSSKARRIMDDWQTDFLTVPEAWYLGTSAGAAYFGDAPGFAPGNPLHALVLADDQLPSPHPLTLAERLERCVYRRQPNAIRAVWSAGRKIYSAV